MTTRKDKPRIKVVKDGPYLVSGGVPLMVQTIVADADGIPYAWRAGENYPTRKSYALCRCGHSTKAPFCDATHKHIPCDLTETASRAPYLEQTDEFDGPNLKLTDAEALCIGASFCDRAGGTWELTRRSDDPEARSIAIQEAGDCPSGRLVVWDDEGNPIEPQFEPSIALIVDEKGVRGPIWVRGGIPIESADGVVYEIRNRVTLCGCGRSVNKPFCDGAHRYVQEKTAGNRP